MWLRFLSVQNRTRWSSGDQGGAKDHHPVGRRSHRPRPRLGRSHPRGDRHEPRHDRGEDRDSAAGRAATVNARYYFLNLNIF